MFNKKNLFVIIVLLLLMTLYTPGFAAAGLDDIDWSVYHDVDFYGQTLHALAENYPDIVVEKGTVDELIAMMIGGNEL